MSAALAFAFATSTANAAQVYITLGFDDGAQSQFANRDVLKKYGVNATYFINSGNVDTPAAPKPGAMNWDEIRTLKAEGNEIAGHTRTHVNLTMIDPSQLDDQICGDHDEIESQVGGPINNFAYPYGVTNSTATGVVDNCYLSARTTAGIDAPGEGEECSETDATKPDCVWAETRPPKNLFDLRAGESHLNNLSSGLVDKWRWFPSDDSRGIKGAISRARNYKGGWFNIVLHDICVGPGDDTCASGTDGLAIPKDRLDNLLRWIQADPELQVVTEAQALGQVPIPPKVLAPTPPAPPAPSVSGASGATLSVNPLARIAGARKTSKRGWKLTIRLARPASARKVQVLVDGRVAKTLTRLASSQSLTVRVGSGKHKVQLRTTATDGKVYTSATKTIGSKAKKKKKKK